MEQTEVDAGLGAVRSRLGKRGRVLRRSATRLVVRFEGETALTRIRPHLVRVLPGDESREPAARGSHTATGPHHALCAPPHDPDEYRNGG
ncbi:MAG: hypothetical protein ACRDRX_02450 [Pseudonocardiaceae bacterium]